MANIVKQNPANPNATMPMRPMVNNATYSPISSNKYGGNMQANSSIDSRQNNRDQRPRYINQGIPPDNDAARPLHSLSDNASSMSVNNKM